MKALAANGFRYISDGKSCKPYKRNGIICIPARSGGIPNLQHSGYYTVVLHAHEWVREDKMNAWDKLRNICLNHSQDIVSYEEYICRGCGSQSIQYVSEKAYMSYENHIKPLLRRIKRFISNR